MQALFSAGISFPQKAIGIELLAMSLSLVVCEGNGKKSFKEQLEGQKVSLKVLRWENSDLTVLELIVQNPRGIK